MAIEEFLGVRNAIEFHEPHVGVDLDDDLPRVALYQAVSHYETFLFEFLAMLLRINPYALSPKKQLTVDEVLDAGAFDALVERLIQRELNELRYRSVPDWFRFLGKIVNLNAVSQPDIDRVSELKATRDAHLHNRGIANETYVRKAGGLARAQAGQPVLVSRPYVYDAVDFLKDFIARKAASARERLTPAA